MQRAFRSFPGGMIQRLKTALGPAKAHGVYIRVRLKKNPIFFGGNLCKKRER